MKSQSGHGTDDFEREYRDNPPVRPSKRHTTHSTGFPRRISQLALDDGSPPCITLISMSVTNILALIDAEISKLQEARALIAGAVLQKPENPQAVPATVAKPKTKKRNLSPEGRES